MQKTSALKKSTISHPLVVNWGTLDFPNASHEKCKKIPMWRIGCKIAFHVWSIHKLCVCCQTSHVPHSLFDNEMLLHWNVTKTTHWYMDLLWKPTVKARAAHVIWGHERIPLTLGHSVRKPLSLQPHSLTMFKISLKFHAVSENWIRHEKH